MDEDDLATWRASLDAHALLIQRIEQELKAHGMPPLSWYDVLWPLQQAEGKRLRINELAEQVVLSRTGLVRLVDRLEDARTAARGRSEQARRRAAGVA
jgi:DNA-binding MarR family transcriptional regulator